MRRVIWFCLLACACVAGADQKTSAKKRAAAGQAQPAIPPGAKEIEPGLYRWTDAQGKSWLFRKSPFGVLKSEEKPTAADSAEELPQGLTVKEEGDELCFERTTPFGVSRWRKKKTELNTMEQRAWEREQKRKNDKQGKE